MAQKGAAIYGCGSLVLPIPSDAGRRATQLFKEAGKILDISLLDHIILTEDGYFSMADEGFL